MFIHLHSKETDKLFVVNTDYIVTICDTEYDDSPTPGAILTIIRFAGPVEVKESVADIERLMNRDRVYSTPTTKCV